MSCGARWPAPATSRALHPEPHRLSVGYGIIECMFDNQWTIDSAADESALVERIAELERVKSAAAGIPAARRGRGVASEIALARRDSPARGGRHLGFAKALVYEMPHTLAALEGGGLSEWRARPCVRAGGGRG